MEPKQVKVSELKLGDVVSLGNYPYAVATVEKIDAKGNRHVFRPYVHRGDCAYSGRLGGTEIITYLGHEYVDLHPDLTVTLLETNHKVR